MRKDRLSSKEESKRKQVGQEIEPRNSVLQSLRISTRETPQNRPLAEHHMEAKKITLSQVLFKVKFP